MTNLARTAPQVPVVLASLVLWVSFAWGLPADVAASEGEAAATAAPEDALSATPAETEPLAAESRVEREKVTVWLYAGLGFGGWGIAGNGALNVKYGRYALTLCATMDGNKHFWGHSHAYNDAGLLFGYWPLEKLGIAGGVAWVKAAERGEAGGLWSWGEWESKTTAGFPVEVRYTPVKSSIVGLDITGHINLNDEKIFGGVTVGIDLGKLK